MFSGKGKLLGSIVFLIGLLVLTSCAVKQKYTSLDLNVMPCENKDERFFYAIEFNKDGELKYPKQLDTVKNVLMSAETTNGDPTDLVFFIHGWNKSSTSAEIDYQNFLCRFCNEFNKKKIMAIGFFWPSTITNREEEPTLLMPISYYKIRNRADSIASKTLSVVLKEIGDAVQYRTRFHLIGHSFGARMMTRALETLSSSEDNQIVSFFRKAVSSNVVLINAAMPKEKVDWIAKAISKANRNGLPSRFTGSTSSYLFNIYSKNDYANRYLFPVASIFNDDPAECAAGACGLPQYPTYIANDDGSLKLNASGELEVIPPHTEYQDLPKEVNVWNVNAEDIVFSHTDIYKGRMAKLLAELISMTQ